MPKGKKKATRKSRLMQTYDRNLPDYLKSAEKAFKMGKKRKRGAR